MAAVTLNVFLTCYNVDITLILPDTLTPAELSLLRMLVQGMSVSEIAQMRDRSVKTISSQKAKLYRKLGIRNDLVLWLDLLLRYRVVLAEDEKHQISNDVDI
ncbi:helix-turn-helix transcriptional regulator [Salmonella enterica]|nr:helix-turn-helix transcriptional regulator [Salmonella enterica]